MDASGHNLIICVGSNTLPRYKFDAAISDICHLLSECRVSETIISSDVTGKSSLPYLNAAVKGFTEISLSEAEKIFATIESDYGRTPHSKESGFVPLDIDIVVWDSEVIRPADYARGYFQLCINSLERGV